MMMNGSGERHGEAVVILAALGFEYREIRAHLTDLETRVHPAGTLFEVGRLPGVPEQIVIALIGEGNATAAVLTERAISMFEPAALFFVGIAGALKNAGVELGDVVVGTKIYAYHGGKEENGGFLARPRAWEASHALLQRARHVDIKSSWAGLLPAGRRVSGLPAVHFKPIAAGEVLLDSAASPLAKQIYKHYNDAVAIEMEGGGFAHAAHLNNAVPVLVVRAISNMADGDKGAADTAGWQQLAAAHAGAFALSVVRDLPSGKSRMNADRGDDGRPGVPRHLVDVDAWLRQHLHPVQQLFGNREKLLEVVMRMLDEDDRFLAAAPCRYGGLAPGSGLIVAADRCLRIADIDQSYRITRKTTVYYSTITKVTPCLARRLGVVPTGHLEIETETDVLKVIGLLREQALEMAKTIEGARYSG